MSRKATNMKDVNALPKAVEADTRNSIRHIAETSAINTRLVYSILHLSLYLKNLSIWWVLGIFQLY